MRKKILWLLVWLLVMLPDSHFLLALFGAWLEAPLELCTGLLAGPAAVALLYFTAGVRLHDALPPRDQVCLNGFVLGLYASLYVAAACFYSCRPADPPQFQRLLLLCALWYHPLVAGLFALLFNYRRCEECVEQFRSRRRLLSAYADPAEAARVVALDEACAAFDSEASRILRATEMPRCAESLLKDRFCCKCSQLIAGPSHMLPACYHTYDASCLSDTLASSVSCVVCGNNIRVAVLKKIHNLPADLLL